MPLWLHRAIAAARGDPRQTDARDPIIKSPDELGRQYLGELRELLDEGTIDAELARRILDDLFEPGEVGNAPRLKRPTWLAYMDCKQR